MHGSDYAKDYCTEYGNNNITMPRIRPLWSRNDTCQRGDSDGNK